MKTNDIKALHSKSVQELEVQLNELLIELAQKRLQKAAGKLKNTHVSLLADDVARIKTIISAKKKI
jgi:ribosomal protein L29